MIVPRKLQIIAIPEEPDTQRRLRKKMSLDKMNTEMELLLLRAGSNEKSYQDIDDLINLQNNKNIVIKEADKSSAVVIMETDYYKNLILNMLQDNTYYESGANYKQQKIIAKLVVLVNLYRKGLTKKECDYIRTFECKTSQNYGLPKIHKSQKIKEA
ncbi:unnamed protein product [Mytilus coruscus]|uniref:Uncharacterized protein n=1 Tax=Mytilus coruscus TaxID=42192 RepID=A0A6J8BK10_MYTCO|nr:unnamed protein product [Mytilus coruscus]